MLRIALLFGLAGVIGGCTASPTAPQRQFTHPVNNDDVKPDTEVDWLKPNQLYPCGKNGKGCNFNF